MPTSRHPAGLGAALFTLLGCGHPFALHGVERTPVYEESAPARLDVRARPGGLAVHVEFEALEARRRWRVRDRGDGVIEIYAHGRVKTPAPWLKCVVILERNSADLDLDLRPGRWEVQLVVDDGDVLSRTVTVPAGAPGDRAELARAHTVGEPGC